MKARFLSLAMAALLCSGLALAKVNVNTATLEELDTLYGIGETRAQAIIDYRRQNGPFKSMRDLKKVPGFHQNVIDGLKGKVSFSGPTRLDAADGAATKGDDRKSPGRASKAERPAEVPTPMPVPVRHEKAPAGPAQPALPGKAAPSAAAVAERPATAAAPAGPAVPARPIAESKPATPAAPVAGPSPARPAAPAVPGGSPKPAGPTVQPAGPASIPAPAAPAKPAGPARPAVPAGY